MGVLEGRLPGGIICGYTGSEPGAFTGGIDASNEQEWRPQGEFGGGDFGQFSVGGESCLLPTVLEPADRVDLAGDFAVESLSDLGGVGLGLGAKGEAFLCLDQPMGDEAGEDEGTEHGGEQEVVNPA